MITQRRKASPPRDGDPHHRRWASPEGSVDHGIRDTLGKERETNSGPEKPRRKGAGEPPAAGRETPDAQTESIMGEGKMSSFTEEQVR